MKIEMKYIVAALISEEMQYLKLVDGQETWVTERNLTTGDAATGFTHKEAVQKVIRFTKETPEWRFFLIGEPHVKLNLQLFRA